MSEGPKTSQQRTLQFVMGGKRQLVNRRVKKEWTLRADGVWQHSTGETIQNEDPAAALQAVKYFEGDKCDTRKRARSLVTVDDYAKHAAVEQIETRASCCFANQVSVLTCGSAMSEGPKTSQQRKPQHATSAKGQQVNRNFKKEWKLRADGVYERSTGETIQNEDPVAALKEVKDFEGDKYDTRKRARPLVTVDGNTTHTAVEHIKTRASVTEVGNKV
jgi:hypothetical protein